MMLIYRNRIRSQVFFAINLALRQLLTGRISRIAIGIVIAIAAGLSMIPFMAAKQSDTSKSIQKLDLLAVKTETAQPITQFEQSRIYTGTIRAQRSSELSFELNGQVIELLADAGSEVGTKQVLAKLDTRRLEAERDELTARRDQAQAVLDELNAGPRKETIEASRAEVKSLDAQLELAKLNLKRRKDLVSSRSISREEYDQALYDQQATMERLNAAQKRFEELKLGTRKEQIVAQTAVVNQLNANVRAIRVQLDKSVLKAPYGGIISQRLLDEGSTAVATQPVFRIVESGHLEAWIGLPIEIAQSVASHPTRNLRINNQDVKWSSARLVPELNTSTRTQTVIFDLEMPDDEPRTSIVPGQIVRIEIKQNKEANGFWVPNTSLVQSSKGLWSVFIVESSDGQHKVARREVEIIENSSNRSLVRGTLNSGEKVILGAGDQVIAEGIHRIVPGQAVEIAR